MILKDGDGIPHYKFDRSRLETAADCYRKYYWNYGFLGIGIVKVRDIPPYWPFYSGRFIHEGAELVIKGVNGRDAADKVASDYVALILPLISSGDMDPEVMARMSMELDQEVDLVKALVYGWSIVGYPRLLSIYQPVEGGVEQEEEISWLLDRPPLGQGNDNNIDYRSKLTLMTRTDILVRSKYGPTALLVNLKSVKDPNERWRNTFSKDMQTLTEAIAVEERLGIKVDGVIIEGLVKGSQKEWPKGSGFWQYYNSLIYCWAKDSTEVSLPGEQGGMQYEINWDYTCTGPHVMGNNSKCPGGRNHTLGKGFRKRRAAECYPGGVYAWVDYVNEHDRTTLESYFVSLPPINRDAYEVERWKRQTLIAEKDRQDKAATVDSLFIAGEKNRAYEYLDYLFPMNSGYECLKCSYQDICWASSDPFDESKWGPRVPNHASELAGLVRIEGT